MQSDQDMEAVTLPRLDGHQNRCSRQFPPLTDNIKTTITVPLNIIYYNCLLQVKISSSFPQRQDSQLHQLLNIDTNLIFFN